jgi:type I restriction enzyme S subunit
VSPKDMKRLLIDDAADHITRAGVAGSAANILPNGSILVVTRSGILSHSLPVAKTLRSVAINQDMKALVAEKDYDPDFLLYALRAYEDSILQQCRKSGTTVANLDTDRFLSFGIPIPPYDEQRRIVDKLDGLIGRSKTIREELAHLPRLFERHKQAVLSAAFQGVLTQEDADKWQVVPLGEIISEIHAGKNVRCDERPPRPGERGIVKVSSVSWGTFNPLAAKTPSSTTPLNKSTVIEPGDFLLSRANTLELVGACVIVGSLDHNNLYLSDKVLRIRFSQPIEEWVLCFLRSKEGRAQIENLATGNQLSMRNISQTAIKAIRMPLPPNEVRECVLDRVRKALASVEEALREAARASELLDRLDQATLAKAFAGNL